MFIIRVGEDANVLETSRCSEEFTNENVRIVKNIPTFVEKEGYAGVLKYTDEQGIYWDYVEIIPVEDEIISSDEFRDMIEEVL